MKLGFPEVKISTVDPRRRFLYFSKEAKELLTSLELSNYDIENGVLIFHDEGQYNVHSRTATFVKKDVELPEQGHYIMVASNHFYSNICKFILLWQK